MSLYAQLWRIGVMDNVRVELRGETVRPGFEKKTGLPEMRVIDKEKCRSDG